MGAKAKSAYKVYTSTEKRRNMNGLKERLMVGTKNENSRFYNSSLLRSCMFSRCNEAVYSFRLSICLSFLSSSDICSFTWVFSSFSI